MKEEWKGFNEGAWTKEINVNDLINYFGEYNINNKKTTNEEVKCVKTITAHT